MILCETSYSSSDDFVTKTKRYQCFNIKRSHCVLPDITLSSGDDFDNAERNTSKLTLSPIRQMTNDKEFLFCPVVLSGEKIKQRVELLKAS